MTVWTTPSPPPPPPPPPPHLRSRLSPHWEGMKCNSTTWWNKAFQFWRGENESSVDLSSYSLISVALFLCVFFIWTSRLLHLWNSIFIPPPLPPLPPSPSLCGIFCISLSTSLFHQTYFSPQLICLPTFPSLLSPVFFSQLLSHTLYRLVEWVIFNALTAGGWHGVLHAAQTVPQRCIFGRWLIISESFFLFFESFPPTANWGCDACVNGASIKLHLEEQ